MSTEYSVGVSEWNWEEWDFVGRDVMYGFYEENPKEAEKDGYEVEDGKVTYLEESVDEYVPMMLYAYPLDHEPERGKIIELCRKTNCTVVMKKDTEEYFLALTGGGMDLSQDIALAYIIAQGWIPTALAYAVSTQPELSVSKKDWLEVAERCKKELEFAIDNYKRKIEEWEDSIKKIMKSQKPMQICNECGRSVAFGSGLFTNRVPDCNDSKARKESGKPFPEGDYLCAECDSKSSDEVD